MPDLVNLLFSRPYITIQDVAKSYHMAFSDAGRLIQELEDKGIIKELTGRKRGRVFEATKILDILTRLERV